MSQSRARAKEVQRTPATNDIVLFRSSVGLPDGRYFTAKLAEAGKRPVFRKSVPKAGILKINNLA